MVQVSTGKVEDKGRADNFHFNHPQDINAFSNKPYSADVRLILHANGREFELAKVSSKRVVLRQPATLPPCNAELTINNAA